MVGILVASTSFTLLTASVRTSRLITIGTVQRNARSAYDILVRPPGTRTRLEHQDGLVQDNFLSGIYGGISLSQYHQIARIDGVAVAAPAANLGYIVVEAFIPVSVRRYLTNAPFQAFRIGLRYVVGGGQHVYDDADLYVYVTRDQIPKSANGDWEVRAGHRLATCIFFNDDPDGIPASASALLRGGPHVPDGPRHVRSAFDPRLRSSLNCVSRRTGANYDQYPGVTNVVNVEMPVQVTAIDPSSWDRLIGLRHAIISGHMLRPAQTSAVGRIGKISYSGIPVLLTSRPYASESLDVQVQRLLPASPSDLPSELSTPAAYRYLTGLPGRDAGHQVIPLTTAYAQVHEPIPTQYSAWMPGPVSYRRRSDGVLAVRDLGRQAPRIWSAPITTQGFDPAAPVDNTASQVRPIVVMPPTGNRDAPGLPIVVGRFDPRRLRGFSALSQVPLATFRTPLATGADPASVSALHGRPLQPDRNLGGYLEQPPALLTTLNAIPSFINSRFITHKACGSWPPRLARS